MQPFAPILISAGYADGDFGKVRQAAFSPTFQFAGAGFDEFAAVLCEGECEDGEVPVPGTALLLGLGLLGIFGRRRIVA